MSVMSAGMYVVFSGCGRIISVVFFGEGKLIIQVLVSSFLILGAKRGHVSGFQVSTAIKISTRRMGF